MRFISHKAAVALAALTALVALNAEALAQKMQFVRSKPHVNVGPINAGAGAQKVAPSFGMQKVQKVQKVAPSSRMQKVAPAADKFAPSILTQEFGALGRSGVAPVGVANGAAAASPSGRR
ncbi:MAG: hypothetical protein FJX62_08595 [Alphaproteobacteria bacterium]|nr:hypothetical protein [Alphaproteobacteria bacterium]